MNESELFPPKLETQITIIYGPSLTGKTQFLEKVGKFCFHRQNESFQINRPGHIPRFIEKGLPRLLKEKGPLIIDEFAGTENEWLLLVDAILDSDVKTFIATNTVPSSLLMKAGNLTLINTRGTGE